MANLETASLHYQAEYSGTEKEMAKEMGKMTSVNCTVSDCGYWGKGNICDAGEITVTSDAATDNTMMEVGAIGKTPSKTSANTACKTFKPKK